MQYEVLPVTRFEQNCSILWCERTYRAAVIDPGGHLELIENLLELQGLTLKVVLVTHGHMGHAGGAAALAMRSGARIEGPHRAEESLVVQLAEQGKRYGLKAQPYSPQRWLDDGDRVRFGEQELHVLHCPGHTRGHVAYFSAVARTAFVGGILFRGSIGAWEHADGNLPALLRSIRHKLFALGDDVRFVPGHGAMSTFGRERDENPFVSDAAAARWPAHVRDVAPGCALGRSDLRLRYATSPRRLRPARFPAVPRRGLPMAATLYDIPVKTIDGESTTLSPYKGKVLLIVNVASKCGLTPQYTALEKLYQSKHGSGFEILAFPANNFKGQEPGTDAEIKQFCSTNYDVHFPLFSKISVVGEDKHPLYRQLTSAQPEAIGEGPMRERLQGYGIEPTPKGEVLWNFEKFLVSRDGKVVARFAPDVTPDDPRLVAAIDAELAKKPN